VKIRGYSSRNRGYFSKPKRPRKQKRLGNTILEKDRYAVSQIKVA
jgi:hypothetical protein